jgi:hypothetical protein
MKTAQFELRPCADAFNLIVEQGLDPVRVAMDRARQQQAAAEAAEFRRAMQRTLAECPGFVGCDAPAGQDHSGQVDVDPARVFEARAWLSRRFEVDRDFELNGAAKSIGLRILPRQRRNAARKRRSFGVEQFELALECSAV